MQHTQHKTIDPIEPLIGWIGGKKYLAKTICPIIDHQEHRVYAEPFVGMGGIFLRRKNIQRIEIINKLNGNLKEQLLINM